MEMDAALSVAGAAVENYRTVTGSVDIDQPWDAVRTQCYEAAGVYLSITATESDGSPTRASTPESVRHGTDLLQSAGSQIGAFMDQHSRCLNAAAASIAAITATAQAAQDAAAQSRALCGALDATMRTYSSVCNAEEQLNRAVSRLAPAQLARNYPDMSASAQQVTEAVAHLDAVVRDVPRRAADAQQALSSISTRIAGTRTRSEGVASALSALLKEFVASSSSDLVGNEAAARERIDDAAECFGRARSAQHNGDPEEALALAKQIRTALTQADQLIDAVPGRLRVLRELREQPTKRAEQARFTLHDAQMFAVSRGITKQWGSVLDAQLKRIELLEATLNTVHPDYWAYATGLDQVNEFIASVVMRMRGKLH